MGKISSRYSQLLRPESVSNEFWPTMMTLQTITVLIGHHSSSSRKFPLGGSAWKTQQHSFFVVDYVCSSGISRNLKSMWRNAGESHDFIYTRYCVDEMCPPTTDTNASGIQTTWRFNGVPSTLFITARFCWWYVNDDWRRSWNWSSCDPSSHHD